MDTYTFPTLACLQTCTQHHGVRIARHATTMLRVVLPQAWPRAAPVKATHPLPLISCMDRLSPFTSKTTQSPSDMAAIARRCSAQQIVTNQAYVCNVLTARQEHTLANCVAAR